MKLAKLQVQLLDITSLTKLKWVLLCFCRSKYIVLLHHMCCVRAAAVSVKRWKNIEVTLERDFIACIVC